MATPPGTLLTDWQAYQKSNYPPKAKDPGCLTLLCSLNDLDVEAMIDSGSSINLIPTELLKEIGGLVLKPSDVTITTTDGSKKVPVGMVENVVVRADCLEFLADFIVMDVKTEEEYPVILGRPFMATSKMFIDVHNGRIMMRDLNYLFLYIGREGDEIKIVKRTTFEKPKMNGEQEENIASNDYFDNCCVLQVPEDKRRKTIHPESKEDPLQPGSKVRFKKKEWIVKELKEKGMMEIQRPYSTMIKKVGRRKVSRWDDEDPNVKKKS